jgi:hypothetical protein
MTEAATAELISDEEFYQQQFVQRPVELICPEHGVNTPWLPATVRDLWQKGYSDQEIFALVYSATRVVKHRRISESEINRAIELIVGTPVQNLPSSTAKTAARYDPAFLAQIADRIPDVIDAAYLEARSQFTCWNRTPAGFLHKLYEPGEKVWVTGDAKSGQGFLWTHQGCEQRFDELGFLARGQALGAWFLINPISGDLWALERCKTQRNPDGFSFTTLECTSAWRHALIESDEAPKKLWLRAVVQMRLPIVAIYLSGKRSVHVLVRFDVASKQHLAEQLTKYEDELVKLGACPGSLTPRRLSRLPNCIRGETQQLQQLLYLRPDAEGIPICEIPPREVSPPPGAVIHNYEDKDL